MTKRKMILSIALMGTLALGVLSACAPAAQPAQETGQATTVQAPAQPPAGTTQTAPDPAPAEAITDRGLTIGIQLEAGTIAPARHTSMTSGHKNHLTHNGLFRASYADLEPIPDLVSEWRIISDTLFEFTLHEGIFFHNGDEMTAYDVVASLEYVRTHPYARAIHASIADWEVVDRYTFIIDTGEPNAQLLNDLTHQANFIMPRSLIDAGHDFTALPIGSGPFVFEEWRFGDSLSFSRFDKYFDSERFPHMEYITWRIIPEGSSRTIALETGEIDYIVEVPFPDIPRLDDNPALTVFQRPGITLEFMLLNNDAPQFQNVYVRRAIDMAIDKDAAVIASVDGWGVPTWSTTPSVLPGSSDIGIRSFDPDGARALLAEHNIDPATLGFEMLAFNEEGRRRGEIVQANLADIGIATTISMVDLATFLSITQTVDYEAGFSAFTQTTLTAFMRGTMHLDSIDGNNRSRMRNQEITDLIDLAVTTVDTPARMAILHEASTLANAHAGHVPMHLNIMVRAFNANLYVPEVAASGLMYLNMVRWTQ